MSEQMKLKDFKWFYAGSKIHVFVGDDNYQQTLCKSYVSGRSSEEFNPVKHGKIKCSKCTVKVSELTDHGCLCNCQKCYDEKHDSCTDNVDCSAVGY